MRKILAGLTALSLSIHAQAQLTPYGKTAWAESATPIHPGVPGQTPFWNGHAKRFIYAPAFDYQPVANARQYRFNIVSLKDGRLYSFKAASPASALTPIWPQVPVGKFSITVAALDAKGDSIGLAGQGQYYRAAPFNGVYHQPVMAYDASARLALETLLDKDYVKYWETHQAPDPDYPYYRYPAKIYSALIIGAVTEARLAKDKSTVEKNINLARTIADNLISISYNQQSHWPNFPPTYYGPRIKNKPDSHMQLENNLTTMGVDAGTAYLDLYDLTKQEKYLDAAKKIAATYVSTQLPNGTWYILVDHITGKPYSENLAIPTAMINYFDRLRRDYQVRGLETATAKAFEWVMNNPAKTYNWSAQFEDVKPHAPYENQSREQACELAMYLFRNFPKDKQRLAQAEELLKFAEDQFVTWEQADDFWIGKHNNPGAHSVNWITPSVHEQYVFWMPVNRSACIMIDAYVTAYAATGNALYLAKAKSIANAITLVQQANYGEYPTMFISTPWNYWLNSTVYPAKVMMMLSKVKE